MNDIAIKVENLGKKYVINHENENGDDNLREVIIGNAKKIITSLNPFDKSTDTDVQKTTEDFWALNDVNFEIKKGDKVGIIGGNGAGKSTLLKVLSRITEPTTGKIHINGRIASLLEVGTGFHPELTGRENIYLNGAILGMSRKEIKEKFDEIVTFAEVEKFLDTPVKRYSSGMYVRLAFSVAAHLEPEILVVDEVLAVGDVEFQKKCLGKMGEVSKEGRTILFVSHNMNAIEQLCDHVIYMKDSKLLKYSDKVKDLIDDYLNQDTYIKKQSEWSDLKNKFNNKYFKPTYFGILNMKDEKRSKTIKLNTDIDILIKGNIEVLDKSLQVGYAIYDTNDNLLFVSIFTDDFKNNFIHTKLGENAFYTKIPKNLLNEGIYRMELLISLYKRYWIIDPEYRASSIFFTLHGEINHSPYWTHKRRGILAPKLQWKAI